MVENAAKIAITYAKMLHHNTALALRFTSAGLLKSDFFLDGCSQVTVCPRVRSTHHLYFGLCVLSPWCCACSVETCFLSKPSTATELLSVQILTCVRWSSTWSRVVNYLDSPAWCLKTLWPQCVLTNQGGPGWCPMHAHWTKILVPCGLCATACFYCPPTK